MTYSSKQKDVKLLVALPDKNSHELWKERNIANSYRRFGLARRRRRRLSSLTFLYTCLHQLNLCVCVCVCCVSDLYL